MYEYDVFLSYPRKPPIGEWVKNHFYPLLAEWLPENLPVSHNPNIFIDFGTIETGSTWPLVLQRALSRSRTLLPIFSPGYFRSPWCCSELETMRRREDVLKLRTLERPKGLIYPIVFWDGQFFPDEVRTIQARDFHRWADPQPSFRDTTGYSAFLTEVRQLTAELADLISATPEWSGDWPAFVAPSRTLGPMALPRIT